MKMDEETKQFVCAVRLALIKGIIDLTDERILKWLKSIMEEAKENDGT